MLMGAEVSQQQIDANELHELLLCSSVFGERADLRNHHVHGALKLHNASICGVDFSGSTFNDSVDFSGSVFEGLSWFKNVVFTNTATFSNTRFSNDARFDDTSFHEGADFSAVTFWGVSCFDGVVAHQQVQLKHAMAYGNLSMAKSTFQQGIQLHNTTLMGGIWMPQCAPTSLHGLQSCDVSGRIETSNKYELMSQHK